jgi:hypothetical protein
MICNVPIDYTMRNFLEIRLSSIIFSSSAEIKNVWCYISAPPYACVARSLVKHQGQTLPL